MNDQVRDIEEKEMKDAVEKAFKLLVGALLLAGALMGSGLTIIVYKFIL